MLKAYGP
jgi:hypothetical protein